MAKINIKKLLSVKLKMGRRVLESNLREKRFGFRNLK